MTHHTKGIIFFLSKSIGEFICKMEVYLSPNGSWPNWVRICVNGNLRRCGVDFSPRNPHPSPLPVDLDLGFIEENDDDEDVMKINYNFNPLFTCNLTDIILWLLTSF